MRVYIATPTDLFRSRRYAAIVWRAKQGFPDAEFIEPAHQCWTLSQWQAEWPKLLPTLDALAVIPRADGTVGRGCHVEMLDCLHTGLPVKVWLGGKLTERFQVRGCAGDSYRSWVKLLETRSGAETWADEFRNQPSYNQSSHSVKQAVDDG